MAEPEANVPTPTNMPESMKDTVPVAAAGATVAVSVTSWADSEARQGVTLVSVVVVVT